MLSTGISLLLLLITFGVNGQYKTKKYIKRNRKAPFLSCDDKSVYARGLHVEGEKVFTGNSDGTLYYFNTKKGTKQMLFRLDGFKEMRDVERSGEFIIGMHSGNDGKLVRMSNSGRTEMIEPEDWKGLFLDGMDFKGNVGFIMGDPRYGYFGLYHTSDSGETWEACEGTIRAEKDEAGFAASGSNVQVLNDSTFVFVSGGEKSRFFKTINKGNSWNEVVLPFYPGKSSGAFSVHFSSDSVGVIVGGDYENPDLRLNTTYYTTDGGQSWFNAVNSPRGYRSCVYHVNNVFYACGRNGMDFSLDGGVNWIPFANGTFYSIQSNGEKLYASTTEGRVQVFNLIENKD